MSVFLHLYSMNSSIAMSDNVYMCYILFNSESDNTEAQV